jgi:hypothetical protein
VSKPATKVASEPVKTPKKASKLPAPPADLPPNVLSGATLRQKAEARKKNNKGGFQLLAELEAQKLADEINAQKAASSVKASSPQISPPKKDSKLPVGGTRLKAWSEAAKFSVAEEVGLEAEYPALTTTAKSPKPVPPPIEIPSESFSLDSPLSRSTSSSSLPSPQPAMHPDSPLSSSSTRSSTILSDAISSMSTAAHWQQVALDAQQRLSLIESEMAKVIGLFDGVRSEYENRAMMDHARAEKSLQEQRLKVSRLQMAHNVLVTLVQNQVDSLIPEEFFCPVSLEMMRDPVVTTSGHSYERTAIERVLRSREEDPLTRQSCKLSDLRPNYSLKTAIDAWKRTRDSMRVALTAAQMYSVVLSPGAPSVDLRVPSGQALPAPASSAASAHATAITVASAPEPASSLCGSVQKETAQQSAPQQNQRKRKQNAKQSHPRPHRV